MGACVGIAVISGFLTFLAIYLLTYGRWALDLYQGGHAIAHIKSSVAESMIAIGYAAISGWFFWLIARWRSPA